MTKRFAVILVILILLGIGIFWWRPESVPQTTHRETPSTASRDGNWASGASGAPSKLPRKLRDRDHRNRPAPTHAPAELKDFIIPSLELKDASLAEALTVLFDQYNEICAETGEVPLRFNYRIMGEPDARLDLNLRQVSFLQALSVLAARTGLALDRDGTKLVFSQLSPEKTAEPALTSSRRVPPDFGGQLDYLLNPAAATPIGGDDPFAGKTAKPTPQPDLREMLRRLGVIRSADATVSYLSATSTLVVRGSAADQKRLENFLDAQLPSPVLLKSVIKFVDSPEPIKLPDGPLNDQEYQDLMRDLVPLKDVSLITQPSVLSRPGQDATIEMIREVINADPDAPDGVHRDWIGDRINLDAGGYGFDLQGDLTLESRKPVDDRPDAIAGSELQTVQHLPDGSTFVVETTTPDGKPRYAFVTIQKLDPSGRPIPPRGDPE